ncbi:MAG: hypothetical protein KDK38_11930, partial [Leptospiraceae bacterium]|nr:hypothetical protein [Leptospiraceae bacterium]
MQEKQHPLRKEDLKLAKEIDQQINQLSKLTGDRILLVKESDTQQLKYSSFESLIRESILEHQAIENSFAEGHVYCWRCQQSRDEHTQPASEREVFLGYSPQGQPQWGEFAQALLDLKDPRYYLAFEEKPVMLSRYLPGRELSKLQLKSHGKGNSGYRILSQIYLGYLPGPTGKMALTIQIIEWKKKNGKRYLNVNIIGKDYTSATLRELLSRKPYAGVFEALTILEQNIAALQNSIRLSSTAKDKAEKYRQIPVLMKEFETSLQKLARRKTRRTEHAQARLSEKRPVNKALDDLRAASNENIFKENKDDRRIVIGPKNRVHVFEADGKHITSLTLDRVSIDRRLKIMRWLPLASTEKEQLRRIH